MNKDELLLTPEEIIIAICGDCPFEGRLTDEDCHACQRQLVGTAKAQLDKVLKVLKHRLDRPELREKIIGLSVVGQFQSGNYFC